MRQQVLVIHGGTTFDNYEKYLEYLKNEEIYLDRLIQKGWKENLQEILGKDFDVILAKMPNKNNAKCNKHFCFQVINNHTKFV